MMAVGALGFAVLLETALQPARRAGPRLGGIIVGGGAGRTLVEGHHDVGPDKPLGIDHVFGREHVARAVDVRLETTPLLGEFADTGEREDLKSAAVGQYGSIPSGKTVQAAGFVEDVGAGSQVEMIRIAEDDLRSDLVDQITMEDAYDAADGADRHKNGGLDFAVVGTEHAGPRGTMGVCMFEGESHAFFQESERKFRAFILCSPCGVATFCRNALSGVPSLSFLFSPGRPFPSFQPRPKIPSPPTEPLPSSVTSPSPPRSKP